LSVVLADRTLLGVLGVLAAALLFSTSGTSKELLAPDAGPPSVAAVRLLVGAAGMAAFVVWRRSGTAWLRLMRRPLVWVMALGVAGYQAFFFIGVQAAGVASGTLVALGAAPFLAGVLGCFVGESAPGWPWAAATTVAVIGLVLLTGSGQAPLGGVLAALAAACSYAIYTVFGARMSRAGEDPSTVLAAAFTIGAALLTPFLLGAGWLWSLPGLALAAWLGLGATTVAYLLFGLGLPLLQPGHIATLTLVEPVGATLWGVILLGERLSPLGWVGCSLIVVAVAIVGVRER
jgi:DME family drug/metabolite transporter